jgi:hypothetical protein
MSIKGGLSREGPWEGGGRKERVLEDEMDQSTYVYMYIHTHTYMCRYIYISTCICIYVHVYICIYVHIYLESKGREVGRRLIKGL